jgi:hypothetical protein
MIQILLCCPVVTPAVGSSALGEWTRLDTPAICVERPVLTPWLPASHIQTFWANGQANDGDMAKAKLLDFGEWSQWAETEARAAGRLEVVRLDGGLLARGEAAAVAALAKAHEGLQAHAQALWIDVEVKLEVGGRAVEAVSGRQRTLPGEVLRFGALETTPFVAGFDIEVATDAGTAAPRVGAVQHGTTLSVSVVRLDGGRSLRIDAWLDGAVLEELKTFDAGSNDSGNLELPQVRSTQLACAAIVRSGGELVAQAKGGAWPEGAILRIQATARADAQTAGRVLLDTSAVSRGYAALAQVVPGFPFRGASDAEAPMPAPLAPQPILAGTVGALLARDKSSGSFGLSKSAPSRTLEWSDHLLAVPDDKQDEINAARELLAGLLQGRTTTHRLVVEHPHLSADVPMVMGRAVRLTCLREHALPAAIGVEIAQQSWLAVPELQIIADGVSLDALLGTAGVETAAWLAQAEPARTIEREAAHIARMQLASRKLSIGRPTITQTDAPYEVARSGSQALQVRWMTPNGN